MVLKTPDEYTIESALTGEAVDLGARIAADEGRGLRLNQLLEFVDEVQDAEGGEEILAALLRRASRALASERAAVVPCASRSRAPLWNEAIHSPPGSAPELAISRSIAERTLSEVTALCVSDAATDPRTRGRESIIGRRVGSILSVPIAARSRVHGVLYLEGPQASGPPGRWRWDGLGGLEREPASVLSEDGGRAGAGADRKSVV